MGMNVMSCVWVQLVEKRDCIVRYIASCIMDAGQMTNMEAYNLLILVIWMYQLHV